jgi:hypothetical protein
LLSSSAPVADGVVDAKVGEAFRAMSLRLHVFACVSAFSGSGVAAGRAVVTRPAVPRQPGGRGRGRRRGFSSPEQHVLASASMIACALKPTVTLVGNSRRGFLGRFCLLLMSPSTARRRTSGYLTSGRLQRLQLLRLLTAKLNAPARSPGSRSLNPEQVPPGSPLWAIACQHLGGHRVMLWRS